MALFRCPECEKEISDKAEKCPNCGYVLKQKNKKILLRFILSGVVVIVLFAIAFFFILEKYRPANFFQFGSAEVQSDFKKTEKGSLSNPYNMEENVNLKIYDVQGYNYATGIRTVANPAEINISIEAPLSETIQDIYFMDGTVPNEHFYFVGLAIDCISTTGDLANLFQYQLYFSFLTKDKQTVGKVIEAIDLGSWAEDNDIIKKYTQQSYYNADIYEGHTTRILIGGYRSKMDINSIDELDLLKIEYFDENGDYNSVYISLDK